MGSAVGAAPNANYAVLLSLVALGAAFTKACDKCEFSDSTMSSPPSFLWPACAQDFLYACDDFLRQYPSVNFLSGVHEGYDQQVHVPFDKLAGHRATRSRGECPTRVVRSVSMRGVILH